MATLELHQVGKQYPGGVWAVRGVDLAVTDGEFVVLVGPSGCGKSTTLRMVAGLEEVSEGEIRIAGRVVNEVPARERDIAMVFQEYALYPHMTVRRNLLFGLAPRRRYRSRLRRLLSPSYRRAARAEDAELAARVARAAEVLDIGHVLDRKPRELSGGQRQRVALGRAIVRQPVAFLFDEPLSNLDARLRVSTRTEIKALQRRLGVTSLYVTHDQEEAMTLGDRLVVMKDGRVQQVGTPAEVHARPANRFVAGFVGTPPMNFLEGLLEAGDGRGPCFAAGGLCLRLGPAWAGAPPGPVVLGLRPADLRLAPGPEAWTCRVTVVEHLGDQADVFLEADPGGGQPPVRLVARLPARELPREGETVPLAPDPAAVHLFAPGPEGPALPRPDRP